jgi:hypothetical protein
MWWPRAESNHRHADFQSPNASFCDVSGKRISGHKTLVMVERYAHANGAHIRTAMDKPEERYRKAS